MDKSIHSPYQEALCARLVALRTEAGLTQRQLAERLSREQSVVARIELGERRLDVIELFAILRALEVDIAAEFAGLVELFTAIADEHGDA